jgi:phosphatidylethanolamine-binding protein (PEBP) family uncharacterized protein
MRIVWAALVLTMVLAGCVSEKVSPDAVTLGVEFSWEGTSRCSNVSPVIRVTGAPHGTTSFKVRLVDLNVPTWNHGGGTVAHDGSGVIPAGALKSGYNGPCPPSGTHSYQFIVKALDAEGTVIGEGKSVQKFP